MAAIVAIGACLFGGVALLPISDSVSAARFAGMRSNARLMAEEFAGSVIAVAADVTLIAKAPSVRLLVEATWDGDAGDIAIARARAGEFLTALMASRPRYAQARLIGVADSGREIVRVERTAAGEPVSLAWADQLQEKGARDYVDHTLRKGRGEIYVSAIELNREHGAIQEPNMPVVRVATPLFTPNGSPLGIAIINIDLRPALARLADATPTGFETRLTDGDGRHLAHPDARRAFDFEFGDGRGVAFDFPGVRPVNDGFQLGDVVLSGAASAAAANIEDAAGRTLAVAVAQRELGDGRRIMVLFSETESQAAAAISNAIERYAPVAGVAALAAFLIALVLSRSIARPLAALNRSVNRLQRGEAPRFPRRGPPEVQALVSAIGAYAQRANLFGAVAHSTGDAIVTIDKAGAVMSWNPAAERIFGYGTAEAVGMSERALWPPELTDAHEVMLRALGRSDDTLEVETTLLRKDGRRREVQCSISLIRSQDGDVIGRAAIMRDVTERRRADAMFQLAVNAAPAGMIIVDQRGDIRMANREAEQIFGYEQNELIGRSIDRLTPDSARQRHPTLRESYVLMPSRRAMGAGRDLRAQRKDGSTFPVEVGLNPIEMGDEALTLAVVVDITERRQAYEMFRLAVESAPAAMILVDEKGAIALANRETLSIFGYGADDLVGRPIEALVPQDARKVHPKVRAAYQASASRRRMGEGRDLYAMRKGGALFPVEVGLNPIVTPEGRFTLAVVIDITERKAAEAALQARTADLERLNAELQQFAYITSHDLQEPLRMVSSFCSLLKEEYGPELDQDANEFIDFAVDGATRMRRMISDLLDYSRLQSSEFILQPVSAGDAVEEAKLDLRAAISESDAQIAYDDLPVVQAHSRLLSQLFMNLIGNAIKFRSARAPDIHIAAEMIDGRWRFTVSDNGIGIDPSQREDIFRVFQRLHTRDEYPGTGIGLALCRRIVDRLGGDIWVEGNAVGGSTFCFTLSPAPPGAAASDSTSLGRAE